MARGWHGCMLLCAVVSCVPAEAVLWERGDGGASGSGGGSSTSGLDPSTTSTGAAGTDAGSASTSATSTTGTTTGTVSSCVEEGFDGGQASAAWGPYDASAMVELAYGGTLRFDILQGADNDYNGLIAGPFELDGGFAQMRVLQPPEAGTPVQLFLSVRDPDDVGVTRFHLMIDEDFRPRLAVDDQTNQVVREPFDAVATPWVRTRFEGVDVVFELSADGMRWDERGRAALTDPLGPMHVTITAGSFQPLGSASTVEIDDVVICPGG